MYLYIVGNPPPIPSRSPRQGSASTVQPCHSAQQHQSKPAASQYRTHKRKDQQWATAQKCEQPIPTSSCKDSVLGQLLLSSDDSPIPETSNDYPSASASHHSANDYSANHSSTDLPSTSHHSINHPSTSNSSHPSTDHLSTGHPSTDHPSTGNPSTDHPSTGHPSTDYLSTGHSSTGHPSTNYSYTGNPSTDHPSTGHPSTDHLSTSHPSTDHLSTSHPSTNHLSASHPSIDHPSSSFIHSLPSPTTKSSTPSLTSQPFIIVPDSPVKPDITLWISSLELYISDREILESPNKWLNNNIIEAAQTLLCKQSEGKIFGWQSTQCSRRSQGFNLLPPRCAFIQVLHVQGNHWILVSNVTSGDGSRSIDSVGVYDSLQMASVTPRIKSWYVLLSIPSLPLTHLTS